VAAEPVPGRLGRDSPSRYGPVRPDPAEGGREVVVKEDGREAGRLSRGRALGLSLTVRGRDPGSKAKVGRVAGQCAGVWAREARAKPVLERSLCGELR
jgi:hypothetical protein